MYVWRRGVWLFQLSVFLYEPKNEEMVDTVFIKAVLH